MNPRNFFLDFLNWYHDASAMHMGKEMGSYQLPASTEEEHEAAEYVAAIASGPRELNMEASGGIDLTRIQAFAEYDNGFIIFFLASFK